MPAPQINFENPRDPDNTLDFVLQPSGQIEVSLSDEQPMDSYNATFNLHFTMSLEEAAALRDWLTTHLGKLSSVAEEA